MTYHHALGMPNFTPEPAYMQSMDPYAQRFSQPGAMYAAYGWGPGAQIGMPMNYSQHIDYVREPIPGISGMTARMSAPVREPTPMRAATSSRSEVSNRVSQPTRVAVSSRSQASERVAPRTFSFSRSLHPNLRNTRLPRTNTDFAHPAPHPLRTLSFSESSRPNLRTPWLSHSGTVSVRPPPRPLRPLRSLSFSLPLPAPQHPPQPHGREPSRRRTSRRRRHR